MPVLLRAEIAGMTREGYDGTMTKALEELRAAPGFLMHVAGPIEGGYRITELWESEEALRPWIDPAFDATIEVVESVVER